MNQTEFERAANEIYQRRFGRLPVETRDPYDVSQISQADLADMLPDFVRALAGDTGNRQLHPLVNPALREQLTFDDLQKRSGMTSVDFGLAAGNSLSDLMAERFQPGLNEIATFAKTIDVPNFNDVVLADVAVGLPVEAVQEGELLKLPSGITEGTRKGRLRTFGGQISFSRAAWLSFADEIGVAVLGFSDAFGLIEHKLIAAALEAAVGLTAASGGMTVAGLGAAAAAMRADLRADGEKSNLEIATLVCPPDLELKARVLKAALSNWPANICVNPFLTSATVFYAFCNPQYSAPLKRLRLRNAGVPRLFVDMSEFVKVRFSAHFDVDYMLTPANPGCVKVST